MVIFSFLLYHLIIFPISLLPLRVLYWLSDFLYILFYHVFGYRKKVVRNNLTHSFPNVSGTDLRRIERKFYHHLCDLIVESVKAFTLSNKEMLRRMKITNPEVLNDFFNTNQNVLIAGGHLNNWEWFASALSPQIKHHAYALYRPLRNRFYDTKMKKSRGRNGLILISTKDSNSFFNHPPEHSFAMIFGIDQSPRDPSKCHWMTFLNQETGVMYGLEKYAREVDAPVVYGTISKVRRGYYETSFRLITAHPNTEPANGIIEAATRMLEADILKSPHSWLWTHRRWKRKRPADLFRQSPAST